MDQDDPLAFLEAELDDIDLTDVEDVTQLATTDLLSQYAQVERDLRERLELHHPQTREARELHSKRDAYMLELRRRKLR